MIEYLGRKKKRSRREIADFLGMDSVERIYDYSDDDIADGIWAVYHSWIDESISDYNTDFYYQPRDYIAACYTKGTIL